MIPIDKKTFNQWKRHVQITCSSTELDPEVTIEEVQALIERGNQLKKNGKYSNYDEWANLMWMLKKRLKEIEGTK